MGYKIYGEEGLKRSRRSEFIEWFVVTLFWFPSAIGGWLLHFGMDVWWMIAVTLILAVLMGYKFSAPEKKCSSTD